jgi:four helix bundle protein
MVQAPKYDLEERLISFATLIIQVVKQLPSDRVANHLGQQLLRSGTSAALNYGEALAAESRKDFIHKLKVVLKELNETKICLKILYMDSYLAHDHKVVKECAELIAIFSKSLTTAKKNMTKQFAT